MICKLLAIFVMILETCPLYKMILFFVRNFNDLLWIGCTKTP